MIYGACILVRAASATSTWVLGVTRKDDQDDFGLPGGKVEPGETPLQAAIRELEEEVGLKIRPDAKAALIYVSEKPTITYEVKINDIIGVIPPPGQYAPGKEAGSIFGWVEPEVLTMGTFGKYNKALLRYIGIIKLNGWK